MWWLHIFAFFSAPLPRDRNNWKVSGILGWSFLLMGGDTSGDKSDDPNLALQRQDSKRARLWRALSLLVAYTGNDCAILQKKWLFLFSSCPLAHTCSTPAVMVLADSASFRGGSRGKGPNLQVDLQLAVECHSRCFGCKFWRNYSTTNSDTEVKQPPCEGKTITA